jgi:hypothetical protein
VYRTPRKSKGQGIANVVSGIGQHGERVRSETDDDLGDDKCALNQDAQCEGAAEILGSMIVRMASVSLMFVSSRGSLGMRLVLCVVIVWLPHAYLDPVLATTSRPN